MPNQIKDGTGKGFLSKVNSDNELRTNSTSTSLVHKQSLKGDAYILPFLFTQQASGVAELCATFSYTGTRTLIMHTITVASQETDVTQLLIYAGTTPAGGGAVVTPANLNTSSSKTLPVTLLHQNDGAAPFTPYYQGVYLFEMDLVGGGMFQLNVFDSFIIKPNVPLGLWVNCTNAGSKVRPTVICYEYDLEE